MPSIRTRGFEKISKYKDVELTEPARKTKYSAGYDICSAEDIDIEPNEMKLVPTGFKVYMQPNEFLGIHIRSSVATKQKLSFANDVGIVDADYYNNIDNEGHIFCCIKNEGEEAQHIKRGDRIAQGIFYNYLITDTDNADGKRVGGFGSTGTSK